MKKNDVRVMESGQITATIQKNGLVKLQLREGYFSDSAIAATFYLSASSMCGVSLPTEIVRYRLKHDFGIDLGHYTVVFQNELD